ncbi:MAG: hypothetical protein GXO36_05805, partial [Chloroflexi bacterium]|nr:hypothetical protein [Chloroflexota bacterium]
MQDQLLEQVLRKFREDAAFREHLLQLLQPYFAGRQETEDRFTQLLREIQEMRIEFQRQWEEDKRR